MRPRHTSLRLVLVQERGIALIAALMILLLMSALMIGFTTIVMSDQRYRGISKDRTRAYYGAQSGLEKLTTDLGNLFLTYVAPTNAQIAALANNPPSIPAVTYTAPYGVTAYGVTPIACLPPATFTCSAPIQSGPYQGLMALKKTYNLDAVARTAAGGEAHLTRKIESVAIPVFQFGTFSNVDLAFFAGPNFNFGGRVHTNGNLFLAQGGGTILTLNDKVTAVGDVIRQVMQNGVSINTATTHNGIVSVATSTNAFRALQPTEGSLMGGPGSALNPNWHTVSIGTYNGYIRDGGVPNHPGAGTGAKVLNLPLITIGGANTDLSRRPQKNEDTSNPVLFGERDFGKVSLRILLSDTPTNITNLPTVTAKAPIPLGEVAGVAPDWFTAVPVASGLVAVDANHAPIARSPGQIPAAFKTSGTTLAGDLQIGYQGAFPPGFHVPTFPLHILTGVVDNVITCTSVTATQLVGCIPVANWQAEPTGAAVSTTPAVVTSPRFNNVAYPMSISGAIAAALNKNARTFTINAGTAPYTGALPLTMNSFWVQDTGNPNYANYPTLVTCTGVDLGNSKLTGCSGIPKTATGTPISTANLSAQNTGMIGGYIKIEIQKADFTWQDVTAEILNYGIAGPSQLAGTNCYAAASYANAAYLPNPNAIIRLQRVHDTPSACTVGGSLDSYDYWPNVLFDTREGLLRDVDPGDGRLPLGGLMNYIEIDVANLSRWFTGAAPYGAGSGTLALTNGGYSVYFSDRRNNVNPGPYPALTPANVDATNLETGEYGFEDFVNPVSATGTPNGTLDGGEDVNANNALDVYGEFPSSVNAANQAVANSVPAFGLASAGGAAGTAGYDSNNNVRPWLTLDRAQGQVNRTYLFRRALKLVNGSLGNIVAPGLTVVTENPVYIQGDWNANQTGFGDPHVATSVIADAVTLLSNAWVDTKSFVNPFNPGNFNAADRTRATSWYRLAVIGGKGLAFPWPAAGNPPNDFGTDGGAHNFLRYLESGNTLNYRGAIATFYFNRQAVGTFKCCNTVYGAPTRNYNFDTDFLDPSKLPPLTPVFRDINALGFAQEIRPGK